MPQPLSRSLSIEWLPAVRAIFRIPLPHQGCLAATALLMTASWLVYVIRLSHWGAEPIELTRQSARALEYKIDINQAEWVEWAQLPGIGPVLAQRIVEYRSVHGPFRGVGDIGRVRGIGPKRLAAMMPYLLTDHLGDRPDHSEGQSSRGERSE